MAESVSHPASVNVAIKVIAGSTTVNVPGGAIRNLSLELDAFGFRGELVFDQLNNKAAGGQFEDKLLTPFQADDLIKIELTIEPYHLDSEASATPDQTVVKGIVLRREIREFAQARASSQVLIHRYTVEFCDPAAFYWRQHFPCQLAVDSKMLDIMSTACSSLFTIESTAAALTAVKSQVFLGLHAEQNASFYDFVVDYSVQKNLYFAFDYTNEKYAINATKVSAAQAIAVRPEHVLDHALCWPSVPRAAPACINHQTSAPKTQAITDSRASSPIVAHYLTAQAVSADFDAFVADMTARPQRKPVLFTLSLRCVDLPCAPIVPGSLWKFPSDQGWSTNATVASGEFRIFATRLRLQSQADLDDLLQIEHAAFALELTIDLEQKADAALRLPHYRQPSPEIFIQGLIVSSLGDEGHETWETSEDANQALIYKVKVPAWENKVVSAPFLPTLPQGKLFFPCFREQPVLLGLTTHTARIVAVLGFGAWNTATKDVQGEGMHFGVSGERGASIAHTDESSHSTFKIRGIENKDETQITISQGVMKISVCKVE